MYNKTTKTTLKRLSLILIFSLLLLLTVSLKKVTAFEDETEEDEEQDTDFDQDFEDLLAIDEKDSDFAHSEDTQMRFSDAEVISKAQRFVVELNNDNFKKFIGDHEFALILGYAPWCPRSAELMPQFAEASALLKAMGSGVFMAKVDADRFTKAASALEINGFPTLLLFVNGTSHVYTGGFTAEEIVIWTRKKTGVPVIRLSSEKEAEDLIKKYTTIVVGLFDKFEGQDYKEFLKAANADNEIQFVEANDINVAKVLFPDIKPANSYLVLIKSQPERYTAFEGPFEAEKILHFIAYNKFPLVTQLTEINSAKVYSSPVTLQLLVFAKADDFKKLLEPLQDIARKFKDKIMFVYVDILEENLAKPFLSLYGLEDSESTVVTAFDNKISSKYLLESDPIPSNIEGFCSRVLDGTLSSYFKSQPIPENNGSLVQTIVGKTFDDLVLRNRKNIILEVHAPWCINCETTSKQIEKLAKHFKGLDDLVFAKIDASANEHPKLKVDDYPTVLLYPASDKTNPIKLSTKSSSKELAAFINKHLKSSNQSTKDEL